MCSIGTEKSKGESWRGKTNGSFRGPANQNVGQSILRDGSVQGFFDGVERTADPLATNDKKFLAIFFNKLITVGIQKSAFFIEHKRDLMSVYLTHTVYHLRSTPTQGFPGVPVCPAICLTPG